MIILTLGVLLVTTATKYFVGITAVKVFTLFFGLEGTVLLASAFSPPYDERKLEMPQGVWKKFLWPFTEGRGNAYPIRYNHIFYYGGLVLLAISMVLSVISA